MLDDGFLSKPLAHRGMWNGFRPENSLAAIGAAADAGFGIEIDLQISRDGQAMVFHDDELVRMTAQTGWVAARDAAELTALPLLGEADQTIPTLPQALEVVGGRVPLLIELKDQTAHPGGTLGPLEARVTRDLAAYRGPVAVMSFNPIMVANLAQFLPGTPRGITGMKYDPEHVKDAERLNDYADFGPTGSCFVSHHWRDLAMPSVARLKAAGVPVLCWTIRAKVEERKALQVADNITFEGYRPEPRR